jgi:hypothetical protein
LLYLYGLLLFVRTFNLPHLFICLFSDMWLQVTVYIYLAPCSAALKTTGRRSGLDYNCIALTVYRLTVETA